MEGTIKIAAGTAPVTISRSATVAWGDSASAFENRVYAELKAIHDMLIAKNKAYGNSALDPVRCFSKADPVEQIKVRIDDKISRIQRGQDAGEDTIADLIGYLVLLKLAMKPK